MNIADSVFRVLLHLYPASFRDGYDELMLQAFRDQIRDAGSAPERRRLWIRTFVDLLRSAPSIHAHERKGGGIPFSGLIAIVFWLAAAVFLGRFELHTDDTGVEVFFLLLFTFLLGFWHPRRAWLTALLGLSMPVSDWFWGEAGPGLNHSTDLLILAGVLMVVGGIGSGAGVLLRKLLVGNGPLKAVA